MGLILPAKGHYIRVVYYDCLKPHSMSPFHDICRILTMSSLLNILCQCAPVKLLEPQTFLSIIDFIMRHLHSIASTIPKAGGLNGLYTYSHVYIEISRLSPHEGLCLGASGRRRLCSPVLVRLELTLYSA